MEEIGVIVLSVLISSYLILSVIAIFALFAGGC